ncbi:MAG: NUDIX hydrolase [Treponema sp.]|nr:NUDIX hydrolase [Treponema sp.]
MNNDKLIWTEEARKQVFNCRVFSICESYCKPPVCAGNERETQTFSVIDANDWAIVIPVVENAGKKQFVMVWQWRHGSRELSLEFPGGVFELGENPEEAAARELYEETGFIPGRIKQIGEFSPNPAIMSNKVHFFLAENLTDSGKQNLDKDEYVEVVLVDIDEAIQGMGKPPYIHALMGTALSLYLRGEAVSL